MNQAERRKEMKTSQEHIDYVKHCRGTIPTKEIRERLIIGIESIKTGKLIQIIKN